MRRFKLSFILVFTAFVLFAGSFSSTVKAEDTVGSATENEMKNAEYWYRFEGEKIVNDIGYIDISDDKQFMVSVTKYYGNKDELVIPDEVRIEGYYYDVVGIESKAFYKSELKSIVVPEIVRYMGSFAFAGAKNIVSFRIPNDVAAFEDGVFYSCTSLAELIPAEYPEKITYIGKAAFANTTISSVHFMSEAKYIGDNAFYGCGALEKISLGKRLEYLGTGAFSGCNSVSSVKVSKYNPNYIASYGVIYKVDNDSLTAVSGPGAKDVRTLKSGCTEIASHCFENNQNIEEVRLPKTCTNIQYNAFYGSSVKSVYLNRAQFSSNAFEEAADLKDISVSKYNTAYRAKDGIVYSKTSGILYYWFGASGKITIPSYINEISAFAMAGNTRITELVIPVSCKVINEGAFSGCTSLRKITFESRSTKLLTDHKTQIEKGKSPEYAIFYGVPAYTEVFVPFSEKADSATSIETKLKLHLPSAAFILHK